MKKLTPSMKEALRIMLRQEERPKTGSMMVDGTWLSNRNGGTFIAHASADALYARGLAEVYSLMGVAILTDEGRKEAQRLWPLPCPDCGGLGCTCPGYCEHPGRTDPDHTCPTCGGAGTVPYPEA